MFDSQNFAIPLIIITIRFSRLFFERNLRYYFDALLIPVQRYIDEEQVSVSLWFLRRSWFWSKEFREFKFKDVNSFQQYFRSDLK